MHKSPSYLPSSLIPHCRRREWGRRVNRNSSVGRSWKVGGNIFDYDLGGSGGMPPRSFRALKQLLVQSEAKILIELLNICGWPLSEKGIALALYSLLLYFYPFFSFPFPLLSSFYLLLFSLSAAFLFSSNPPFLLCILTLVSSIRAQFELQSCWSPSGSVVVVLVFQSPGPGFDAPAGQIFCPGKRSSAAWDCNLHACAARGRAIQPLAS